MHRRNANKLSYTYGHILLREKKRERQKERESERKKESEI